ncbi:beta-propeller fold lactonase family protein [uncultured Novosphingobium sp.]|uniref:beta-propeller fold lactonase family protein n=1 Tax=uncultured Novosphingobium sp. TaxID=292277 RepID=UPI002595C755|nr:beta-propeller fold lactonase family protein [uncultured Novosphingobium sp.]
MKLPLLAIGAGLAAQALPAGGSSGTALADSLVINGAAEHPCPQNTCLAPQLVYVGTGTGAIYAARFDPASGTISALGIGANPGHPTWLMPSPHRQVLYAANANGSGSGAQG